jgi:hypothetical protein
MSDKEFASKSFNSLSQAIVNNTANKNKTKKIKKDEGGTILSMICSNGLRDECTNVLFVCTVPPEISRFKHSLAALKFVSKLHSVVRKRIKLVLPEEIKLEHSLTASNSKIIYNIL